MTSVLVLAAAVDGLLAGASLDQSIKQLPGRHRIGMLAFSAFSRASDLTNGLAWYATLGLGGAALTVIAAIAAVLVGARETQGRLLVLAGLLSLAHSFTTARAAPINFSQRRAIGDEVALRRIFDRLERWQTARAALQLATFVIMLCALANEGPTSSRTD